MSSGSVKESLRAFPQIECGATSISARGIRWEMQKKVGTKRIAHIHSDEFGWHPDEFAGLMQEITPALAEQTEHTDPIRRQSVRR